MKIKAAHSKASRAAQHHGHRRPAARERERRTPGCERTENIYQKRNNNKTEPRFLNRTFHGGGGSGGKEERKATDTLALPGSTHIRRTGATRKRHTRLCLSSPWSTGAQQIKGIIHKKNNNQKNKTPHKERTRDSKHTLWNPTHILRESGCFLRCCARITALDSRRTVRGRIPLPAADHVCNQPEQRQGHPQQLPNRKQRQ